MLALLLASLLAQENADDFYKFPVGTTWSYKSMERGKEGKQVQTVQKMDGEKVVVESKEFKDGKEERAEHLVWGVDKGILLWWGRKESGDELLFNLYKVGSKKGDTWSGKTQEMPDGTTMSNEGTEEVKVAAGTYKDAVHIKLACSMKMGDREMKLEANFWMVPKVGMVKLAMKMNEDEMSLELTEFKAAK